MCTSRTRPYYWFEACPRPQRFPPATMATDDRHVATASIIVFPTQFIVPSSSSVW